MPRAGIRDDSHSSALTSLIRLTVCCLLPAASLLAQPALPKLALEAYPAAAREAIARAHRTAVERPADAGATGALGRVLHAWEQWDAARESYRARGTRPVPSNGRISGRRPAAAGATGRCVDKSRRHASSRTTSGD
jgi:hypothetical protein